jgi:hypothetical protein
LYLIEAYVGTDAGRGNIEFIKGLLGIDLTKLANPMEIRPVVWQATFLLMIKAQLLLAFFVLMSAGPSLIADDLKTRALPIYFSRPLQPVGYLMGKGMVVFLLLGIVTILPNVGALVLGTAITGGLPSMGQTLDLAWRILLIGVGVAVIGAGLALLVSSLSANKRYATVALMALCIVPSTVQSILNESLSPERTSGFLGSLALHRDIGIVAESLLGLRENFGATSLPAEAFEGALGPLIKPVYPGTVLAGIVVLSLLVAYRRVLRFSRAAANV